MDARERRDEVIQMLRELTIPQPKPRLESNERERSGRSERADVEITVDRPAADWYFAPFRRTHNADI